MGIAELVAIAIWIMLPAYIPNNVAVLAGGGRPIDGGRRMGDRRLLGDGKTWRGTLAGIAAGMLVALGLNAGNGAATAWFGLAVPVFPLGAIVGLPAGAMIGDILASFVKRRTGRRRGNSFPVVDQLDFVVMALVLTTVFAWEWVLATVTATILLIILVVTPILHIATNVFAYIFGLKHEPW